MNWLTALFVGTANDEVGQLMEEMPTGGKERDFSILEDISMSGSIFLGSVRPLGSQ